MYNFRNALAQVPVTLGISTVGVGTSARFAAINQNASNHCSW